MKLPLAEKPLKVLFVGAEASPYAKVGGLGEVLRALPKAMRELGCDARVFVPKYVGMDADGLSLEAEVKNLRVAPKEEDPHGLLVCNILRHEAEDRSVTYFLENEECFEKRA